MSIDELKTLRENRIEDETVSETKERLEKEGKLCTLSPENLEKPDLPKEVAFDDDLTIPRWKLIQPSCQIEGATEGTFRNTLTDEEAPKLENIVFLSQQNSRSLFAENDFSGAKTCWSYNGYVPAKDQILKKTGEEPQSSLCATREDGKLTFHCPYAVWRNQIGEPDPNGNKPPVCKASISFQGLDLQTYMLFWTVFHGAALPIIKDFLKFINYKREQGRRQGKDIQLYNFRVTIGLQLQSTRKGRFYIPSFKKKEEITNEEEQAVIQSCYESLNGRFLSEPLESENGC